MKLTIKKRMGDGKVSLHFVVVKGMWTYCGADIAWHLSLKFPALQEQEILAKLTELGLDKPIEVPARRKAVRRTTGRLAKKAKRLIAWLKEESSQRIPEGWLHDTPVAEI